jgi:SagB-type dehydrogenase family enzyme
VLESRRSLRTYAESPISAAQLGEFLFRVARVRGSREVELETPLGLRTVEFCSRPYPSGGALYELDFHVAVGRCDGLERGLYRYDPRGHRLALVPGPAAELAQLLHDAAASAGIDRESPQVLVILTARFQRLSWKYASIAYALILKHVGVVYQTMYLAATAMGLAPCALGGGDSDLFARAAGLDYYAETSVGEFLLGSRAPDSQATASP